MVRISAAKLEHEIAHGLFERELLAFKRECERG
jgi:hypothetical protein